MEKPPITPSCLEPSRLDGKVPTEIRRASRERAARLASTLISTLVMVVARTARSDVPASLAPSAPPSEQAAAPVRLSTVRFVSTDAEASFQRKTGTTTANLSTLYGYASGKADSYDEICADPCELKLPAGSYTFAMSHPGHRPVDSAPIQLPPGPSKVIGVYESHASKRTFGRGILLGSVGGGLAVSLHGALAYTHQECIGSSCRKAHDINETELGIGAALMLAGLFIGIPLGASNDTVHLRVIPGIAPTTFVSPHRGPLEGELSGMATRGITLSASW